MKDITTLAGQERRGAMLELLANGSAKATCMMIGEKAADLILQSHLGPASISRRVED